MEASRGGRQGRQVGRQGEMEMQGLTTREALNTKYKRMFDELAVEHGGEIPLRKVRDALRKNGYEELPPKKVNELIRRADADQNEFINYSEFVNLMTAAEIELTKFQKIVRTAVSTVVPSSQKAADGETDMVEDYVAHYNCCPPPIFMIVISMVELGIFIGYAVVQKNNGIPTTMTSGAPLQSPLVYNPYRRYEAWRYLSYMFIHDGIKHILSNLIFQLLLGIPLEMVHKFWRVGIVYCLGVIAGSLCTSIFDPTTYLVGASGGCYALIGAHFAIVIMNWQDMTHDWMSGPIKFLMSAPVRLAFWSIYAGVDTAVAIYTRYTHPEGSRVAYVAHFAGLAAGILIGIPVLRNFTVKPWEKILWWISLVIYLVLVLFAVCFNGFYTSYYPKTDWRPCCPCPENYKCHQY